MRRILGFKEAGNASDDRWMRRKNGERFFATGLVTALKSDSGELIGFTKIMRDVTEQRQMQDQIEYQAERLADESRRKDEFLAMLSHELRNPLASIMNADQLLRRQQERNPIQIQAQGIIDRQVAQLAHLVDDLLEVSRAFPPAEFNSAQNVWICAERFHGRSAVP